MSKLAIFGALVILAVSLYPGRRVLQWYEIATDSHSGAALANDVQDVLQEVWQYAFQSGAIDPKGEVAAALARTLQRQNTTSLVELAAGSGGASISWVQELRKRGIPAARTILTDINPNIPSWAQHKAALGDMVSYVPDPVDATNLTSELAGHVRVINTALHHFPPEIVRRVLSDVVRSRGALFVGDLAANRLNLVMNTPVGMAAAFRVMSRDPGRALQNPLNGLVMPFVGPHDAIVSSLRVYSPDQLRTISLGLPGSQDYSWQFFDSDSAVAALLGPVARNMIASPFMQFAIFAPSDIDPMIAEDTSSADGTQWDLHGWLLFFLATVVLVKFALNKLDHLNAQTRQTKPAPHSKSKVSKSKFAPAATKNFVWMYEDLDESVGAQENTVWSPWGTLTLRASSVQRMRQVKWMTYVMEYLYMFGSMYLFDIFLGGPEVAAWKYPVIFCLYICPSAVLYDYIKGPLLFGDVLAEAKMRHLRNLANEFKALTFRKVSRFLKKVAAGEGTLFEFKNTSKEIKEGVLFHIFHLVKTFGAGGLSFVVFSKMDWIYWTSPFELQTFGQMYLEFLLMDFIKDAILMNIVHRLMHERFYWTHKLHHLPMKETAVFHAVWSDCVDSFIEQGSPPIILLALKALFGGTPTVHFASFWMVLYLGMACHSCNPFTLAFFNPFLDSIMKPNVSHALHHALNRDHYTLWPVHQITMRGVDRDVAEYNAVFKTQLFFHGDMKPMGLSEDAHMEKEEGLAELDSNKDDMQQVDNNRSTCIKGLVTECEFRNANVQLDPIMAKVEKSLGADERQIGEDVDREMGCETPTAASETDAELTRCSLDGDQVDAQEKVEDLRVEVRKKKDDEKQWELLN